MLKKYGYIVAIVIIFLAFEPTHSSKEVSIKINDHLNGIASFQANFKQTIFSPENDVVDYSEGSFIVKKPEKMSWNFTYPSIKKIILNDQKITTYDADLNQAVIVPFSDRHQSSLANILLKNDSLLNFYQISSETTNDNVYSVVLVQKGGNNLFTRIKITITEALLSEIKLWDTSGQSIGISFEDAILNSTIPDSYLEFSIPKGVDVFDQTQ
jgi:outer membrane lipoprotein carrier protein|tara:strand:+ start:148 stop:783 length:636 start_codon:yes stop_codon:yes gene_type:complete